MGRLSVAGDETVREGRRSASAGRCSARSRFAGAVKWPWSPQLYPSSLPARRRRSCASPLKGQTRESAPANDLPRDEIVRLQVEYYGKGPTRAKTYVRRGAGRVVHARGEDAGSAWRTHGM